jgi:hypothetical protein
MSKIGVPPSDGLVPDGLRFVLRRARNDGNDIHMVRNWSSDFIGVLINDFEWAPPRNVGLKF